MLEATFSVQNRFDFVTLANVVLHWRLLVDGMPVGRATGSALSAPPSGATTGPSSPTAATLDRAELVQARRGWQTRCASRWHTQGSRCNLKPHLCMCTQRSCGSRLRAAQPATRI